MATVTSGLLLDFERIAAVAASVVDHDRWSIGRGSVTRWAVVLKLQDSQPQALPSSRSRTRRKLPPLLTRSERSAMPPP